MFSRQFKLPIFYQEKIKNIPFEISRYKMGILGPKKFFPRHGRLYPNIITLPLSYFIFLHSPPNTVSTAGSAAALLPWIGRILFRGIVVIGMPPTISPDRSFFPFLAAALLFTGCHVLSISPSCFLFAVDSAFLTDNACAFSLAPAIAERLLLKSTVSLDRKESECKYVKFFFS